MRNIFVLDESPERQNRQYLPALKLKSQQRQVLNQLFLDEHLFMGDVDHLPYETGGQRTVGVYLIVPWSRAQKERGDRPYDNGHGWDIRFAVPGEPGNDYPTLSTIPKTSFTCSKKEPGYYADVETNCQVFRICTLGSTYGFQSFLCPNGTLFNQAVFVCDWWMNVNCKKSTEYFNSNEIRSNVKEGPELITDVKKMLTHPMRNPYDKTVIRNDLLVTQEYKPPFKIVTNEDYVYNQNERDVDNFYIHPKQAHTIAGNEFQNEYDISYAASTANPTYILKAKKAQQNLPNRFEDFVTYSNIVIHPTSTQNTKQSHQNVQKQRIISQDQKIYQQQQRQYSNLNDYRSTVATKGVNNYNPDHGRKLTQFQNLVKQATEHNYQQKRIFATKNPKEYNSSFYKNITPQALTNIRQNYLRNEIQPTLITKTLAYRKIIPNPKKGQPKSRITFKTWIVKPSRNPRLVAEPTPYTYNSPSTTSQNLVSDDPYYVYNTPENKLNNEVIPDSNVVTRVTPTVRSTPMVTRNTISDRLYLAPLSSLPTKPSLAYLPPTTYKPLSLMYLPPSISSKLQIQNNYTSSPSTQQSRIDSYTKNLSFTDILTKEKLDITVNDIVEDTNEILKSQISKQNKVLKENIQINNEPPDIYYLPQDGQNSDEKVTTLSQLTLPKSSRLTALPSTDLQPPKEHFSNDNESLNRLSNLPFIKESALPKNTIERTVSLKITIPEKIADLLFKSQETNSNNLEILNTGSSNYLVLNNKVNDNFVPLGKLTWNKNANVSSSQDLVNSFLADSINAAKQYSSIVEKQSKLSQNTHGQAQNTSTEEVEQLSDKITHLTSSQYTANKNGVTQQPLKQKQLQQPRKIIEPEDENFVNGNNIYSGQLYKLPVPVVTKNIYNAPYKTPLNSRQNLIESISRNNKKTYKLIQQTKSPTKSINSDNLVASSTIATEIDEQNSLNNQNSFESEYIKEFDDRISAHVRDKTIGTINHPTEDNKFITYKKDKSYYVYTQLNNKTSNYIPIKETRVHNDEFNSHHLTHLQYRPNNEIEQTTNLQNNYESPKENLEANVQNSKRRLDVSANIEYEVDHSFDKVQNVNGVQKLSRLYDGPSSYSAPQMSIGSLRSTESSDPSYNSRLEDLDNNDNNFNGYPKEIPSKRFIF